ncbi:MAG: imelysin family protein [Weeksellaceae bacterium]
MKKLLLSLTCLVAAFTFQSCDSDDGGTINTEDKIKKEVVQNYSKIVHASYQDSYELAVILKDKIDAFVSNPTSSNFQAAKDAWYEAREPYGQTEAYRFAGGPIDAFGRAPEGMLNAWPLDESFIDYVNHSEGVNLNIINNVTTYPTLSGQLLRDLNEKDKVESSVSIGYHAIEFLLWGQDTVVPTAGAEHTTGGNRPYTDFVDGGTASHQDRRRQYLEIAAELLLEDLKYLVDEWDADGNNYRSKFEGMKVDDALSRAIAGIGVLSSSELSEERILVAVSESRQEDEHSCFSDNTHRDIITNYQGIKNVYAGTYTRIDGSKVTGTSIHDLLMKKDEDKAKEIQEKFSHIEANLAQTTIPFDYALTQSMDIERLNTVVDDLRKLGEYFASTANLLEVGTYTAPE